MKIRRLLTIVGAMLGALVLGACGGGDKDSEKRASGADFDRAFIDAMVPHHEAAIEMAEAAKESGLEQPDLIKVANDILATQQDEIDQMKQWRADWFGSGELDPNGGEELGLTDSEMGMAGHDVGMLRSSGDVDRDFAQMMITHHQGAITMAKLAEDDAEHGELRDLAAAIISAQEREIEVMRPHASGHHG